MRKRHVFNTRLDQWLAAHKVKPARLACESGYSRQHLLRIRKGEMEPTRRCIAAIVTAGRKLSGEAVRASELFDLGEIA
jgi:predicted transcriptional regulator